MNDKELFKWRQQIFINQAKLGELMSRFDDEEPIKDVLKNGVKIHKRHRELLLEYAQEHNYSCEDDVINLNHRKIEKFKLKRLKNIKQQFKAMIDIAYDTMKLTDLFSIFFIDTDNFQKSENIKLRHAYLNFVDEVSNMKMMKKPLITPKIEEI